jgi:hypothetical protein
LQPASPTESVVGDGPRKDVGCFHIENEKKDGNKKKWNWVTEAG